MISRMTSDISRGISWGIRRGITRCTSVDIHCRMSGGINQDEKAAQVGIKGRA